ncbi:hypothetical protein ACTXT7_004015 [Hymenolepis weldensis]
MFGWHKFNEDVIIDLGYTCAAISCHMTCLPAAITCPVVRTNVRPRLDKDDEQLGDELRESRRRKLNLWDLSEDQESYLAPVASR